MSIWSKGLSQDESYGQFQLMFSLVNSIEWQKNSNNFVETKLGGIINIGTSTWHRKYLMYLSTGFPEIR